MTVPEPRIARATFINLIGLITPTLVALVTVPLYLRYVGETRYGILLLAFTLLGYFGAFDLGLGRAVAQRIARLESVRERNRTFWTALLLSVGMGLLGGIILYLLGHWLFAQVFQIPSTLRSDAQGAIPWLAAIVPVIAIVSVLTGTLEARQAFFSLNVSQALGVMALQTFPLLSIALGHGSMAALIAAALLGRLVGVLIMLWLTARTLPIVGRPVLYRSEVAPLLRFGGWVSLSGAVIPLLTIVDRLVIGTHLGAAAVTTYAVPYNLTQRLTYLPYALNTTLFPRFSRMKGEDVRDLLRQAVTVLTAVQTPLIVLAILLVHPFLSLWIGSELAARMAPVAIILLLGVWINGPSYPPYAYLPAQGRPDLLARFYLAELVPFLLILWALVLWLGVTGAAVAWTLRSAADAIFWFVASRTTKTFIKAVTPTLLPITTAVFTASITLELPAALFLAALTLMFSMITSYFLLPVSLRQRVLLWPRMLLSRLFVP